MHRSLRFAFAALLVLPAPLVAQNSDKPVLVNPTDKPAPTTTITAESRLVNIPVIVRDNKGALVQNLTKADFSLQVDGKPQVIRYFDLDNNLPLTLGLLVDTSESQRNALDDERSASSAFLDQMLTGKQDQAFVIEFARSVELLQELTSSRAKLQAGLKELDIQTASASDTDTTGDSAPDKNGRTHRMRGGTTLYDAVFLASDEVMSKQKGRKALIVLTDGVDRGSKERLTDAIEAAQRADTIIYAVYFKGEAPRRDSFNDNPGGYPRGGGYPGGGYPGGGYPGGGYPGGGGGGGRRGGGPSNEPDQRAEGKKTLERIAHETGGRLFEVSKKQPVADIYAEIGKELRAQYRLGYTPDKEASEDGYHRLELGLTSSDKKKWVIQTRDGYYTGK
ncbi:VWFA-related protein [Granulicella aggregans]|uniref:VWFA-related protein n=1 Tax=Granulicella aggregans TaxID=474949 RepID=A0A7W7ZF03_9BACT|nr:VWA domain-containing protein [Granulicella aggregans]MBB5058628.1 VWFA-related protein [Granulicella aggregans]